ncbi:hypothetical protein E6Q11_00100 [Candidatus Dojkabacteria bacterium]|uniref:Uncharacterized protein n=1 Tax=Candidatus Dojkabacteria bacterium TaxID=2099670 RepID=A0A5C7JBI0_9BACT|nr:MAG: hypothetical protein E6Q11_00100 [Candidatus Dojkabacteria bacterium]
MDSKSAYEVDSDIKEVVRMMNSTDDRGKLKIKLAAIDAYELHNSHISRTRTLPLNDDEAALVESLRQATKMGKSVIKAAVHSAEKDNSATKEKKAS